MTQCPTAYLFLMSQLSSVEVLSSPRDDFDNSVATTERPPGRNSYHPKRSREIRRRKEHQWHTLTLPSTAGQSSKEK
jgi:hypothetical protein